MQHWVTGSEDLTEAGLTSLRPGRAKRISVTMAPSASVRFDADATFMLSERVDGISTPNERGRDDGRIGTGVTRGNRVASLH